MPRNSQEKKTKRDMKSILCSIENSGFVSDPQNTAIGSEKMSSGAATEQPSPVSKVVFT